MLAYVYPRIRAACLFMDYVGLIEAVLDDYFYSPERRLRTTPKQLLIGMGLPTDIALMAAERITTSVYSSIQAGFTIVYPGRDYSYRILECGDVIISEDYED